MGLVAIIAGIVLLTSATSALAVVLEALLVAAGLDLTVTGTLGHYPLYAKLDYPAEVPAEEPMKTEHEQRIIEGPRGGRPAPGLRTRGPIIHRCALPWPKLSGSTMRTSNARAAGWGDGILPACVSGGGCCACRSAAGAAEGLAGWRGR